MKIRCYLITVLMLTVFTSSAFGAKVNPYKRKAHRSQRHLVHFALASVHSSKVEFNFPIFKPESDISTSQSPLAFVKLCNNDNRSTGKNNDAVQTDQPLRTNQVPLPGALWFFGSGLIGLLNLQRKIIEK